MTWKRDTMRWPAIAFPETFAPFSSLRIGVTGREAAPEAFNLSFTVSASPSTVCANRRMAVERLDFTLNDLVMPAQVHGSDVAVVGREHRGCGAETPMTAIPNCDALVTDAPGLLLGITVADCLPIFLFDPVHRAIGIAHSGWRGTCGRIAVATLHRMEAAFGSAAQDCLVAIGPGIGPDGYEVDSRVYEAFAAEDAGFPGVFTPTRSGHYALDLTGVVVHQLMAAGVPEANICLSPWRTHRDTDLFFSHRLVPGCPRMGAFLGLVI